MAEPVLDVAVAGAPGRAGGPVRRRSLASRTRWVRLLQVAPTTAFLLVFLVAPLVVFLLYSFWATENYEIVSHWTLSNYGDALGASAYRSLLRNTVSIAMQASLCAVVLGYAFAHIIRFHLRAWQHVLLLAVLVAAFSGYLVRIYAWRTILGEHGIINEVLIRLGVLDDPLTFLLYSRTAAIIVLTNFLLPLAILPIFAALQSVSDDEIEASRDLGCGPARTLLKVTLPLAWPGIFAAFALCFVIAAGDFATPQLVGGTSGTMIGRAIADAFGITFDWPTGAALAFITLALVLTIVLVLRQVAARVVR
jgi:spermidine/putrescine transport system permease protein